MKGNITQELEIARRYACNIDKPEIYEYCWMVAFQSDKSILNYMRVDLQKKNFIMEANLLDKQKKESVVHNKV